MCSLYASWRVAESSGALKESIWIRLALVLLNLIGIEKG